MPVMIRLSRQGAKKQPQYLVVAMDKNAKRDGQYLDKLGHYFPKEKETKNKLKVDASKVAFWKARGAQVSETVGHLFKSLSK